MPALQRCHRTGLRDVCDHASREELVLVLELFGYRKEYLLRSRPSTVQPWRLLHEFDARDDGHAEYCRDLQDETGLKERGLSVVHAAQCANLRHVHLGNAAVDSLRGSVERLHVQEGPEADLALDWDGSGLPGPVHGYTARSGEHERGQTSEERDPRCAVQVERPASGGSQECKDEREQRAGGCDDAKTPLLQGSLPSDF